MIVELASINRFYGHGAVLKGFAGLPAWLPLPFAIQHGWTFGLPPELRSAEISAGLGTVWAWTPEVANAFQKLGLDAIAGSAPFLYACEMETNRPGSPAPVGTLAFPMHGTRDVRMTGDFESYARAIAGLPSEFQPVTLCLHPSDLGGPFHQILRAKNLRVINNGPPKSPHYLSNFIRTTRSYRYVTSNGMSTAFLYAATLRIPIFLFGPEFHLENISDPHVSKGTLSCQSDVIDRLRPIFSMEGMANPEAQRTAAAQELGADSMLSVREIREHVRGAYRRLGLRRYCLATTVRATNALVRRLRRS